MAKSDGSRPPLSSDGESDLSRIADERSPSQAAVSSPLFTSTPENSQAEQQQAERDRPNPALASKRTESNNTESRNTGSNQPESTRGEVRAVEARQNSDDTDWAYVNVTQSEPESISNALTRTPPTIQLADGTLAVASVGGLKQLVEHLNRERIKVRELMSSLGFALRSFNNLNQILELIPLVSSRIADASGAALVLFEGAEGIKISRMYCSEGGDCSRIKQALDRAVQSVAADLAETASSQSSNEAPKTAYSPDVPASTSLKLADSFEQLLDERVGLNLGRSVQLFGTSLLSRNVIRGRLYVFSYQPDYGWDAERQKLIRLVADQTAVAIENDTLNSELRYRSRIAQEIAIGSEIQQRLQPQRCPAIAGLDIAARSQSASPVGGDYYDFIQVPLATDTLSAEDKTPPELGAHHRWGIAIGDVMGKGVPAGLLMMATRGVLRAEVLHNREPAQILQHLNRVTHSDMENSRRFVSLFYSDYCPNRRLLRYSNAAHNPSLWWQAATGTVSTLDTDGMLIGVDSESQYCQSQVQLNPGDVVLYYTDGVTEAVNPKGDRFEETGLVRALQASAAECYNAQDILDRLFEQVEHFRQGLEGIQFRDDMTVVVLKVESDSTPPNFDMSG
ncbi:MAG: GAF domain-containing SpoIIE family protein phosphatase [Cyanobacteria bacterium J06597_1]